MKSIVLSSFFVMCSVDCYAVEGIVKDENVFENRLIDEMVTVYPKSVIRFQKKIAQRGSVTAQKLLGHYYKVRNSDPADLTEALKWYSMAADKGDEDAANQIVLIEVMLKGFSEVIHGDWYESLRNIEEPSSAVTALLDELKAARAYHLARESQMALSTKPQSDISE